MINHLACPCAARRTIVGSIPVKWDHIYSERFPVRMIPQLSLRCPVNISCTKCTWISDRFPLHFSWAHLVFSIVFRAWNTYDIIIKSLLRLLFLSIINLSSQIQFFPFLIIFQVPCVTSVVVEIERGQQIP